MRLPSSIARCLCTTLLGICLFQPAHARSLSEAPTLSETLAFSKTQQPAGYKGVVALDLSLATLAITTWGVSQWGWFQHSPVAKTEEWFGADTPSGGADKTGHLYMSYLLSEIFLADFRRHGVDNPERKAALSALAAMTLVEIGDATSDKFGFSSEDLIADAIGVAASWWLGLNPIWDDRIDLRMEYWPSNGYNVQNDAVSDYSGMKHLIALRADGFQSLRHTPLKWLELQAGYYTRGFRTFDNQQTPTRHTYVGLGISLPVLAGKNTKIGKVLSYVQPPGFYLEVDKEF